MKTDYFLSALCKPSIPGQTITKKIHRIVLLNNKQNLQQVVLATPLFNINPLLNCKLILLPLLLIVFTQNSLANDIYATTDAGARAVLKNDSSWSYIDGITENNKEQEQTKVDLKVMGLWTKGNSCRVGLSLMNKKAKFIRNLGLEFTAYVANDIPFDSVIIGFYGIKPTRHQYREAIYHGITCKEINHILVHGGDHCSVGEELVQYSTNAGECLQAINVT